MGAINLLTKRQFVNIQDKNLYVTKIERYSAIQQKALLEAAARNSGISRGQINAAADAIVNEFKNFLLNGHSVQVPYIGSFRLSCRAKATPTLTYTDEKTGKTKQYTLDDVLKRVGVVYTPTSELRQDIANLTMSLTQEK